MYQRANDLSDFFLVTKLYLCYCNLWIYILLHVFNQNNPELKARAPRTQRQGAGFQLSHSITARSCLGCFDKQLCRVLPVATAIAASLASQWSQWWRFLLHNSWKSADSPTFGCGQTRGQSPGAAGCQRGDNRRPYRQQSSPLCTLAN